MTVQITISLFGLAGNKPYRKVVITQGADPTVVAIRGEAWKNDPCLFLHFGSNTGSNTSITRPFFPIVYDYSLIITMFNQFCLGFYGISHDLSHYVTGKSKGDQHQQIPSVAQVKKYPVPALPKETIRFLEL